MMNGFLKMAALLLALLMPLAVLAEEAVETPLPQGLSIVTLEEIEGPTQTPAETPAPTATPEPEPTPTATPEDERYLTFTETDIVLNKGKKVTMKPVAHGFRLSGKTRYTWSVSKTSVAGITKNGLVTAKGGGTCKIWCSVTVDDITYTAEANLTVMVPMTGVAVDKKTVVLMPGESWTPVFTCKPEDVSDPTLTFESANEEIATVDEDGTITAVAPGTAKVTATAADGSEKKASVTVYVATLAADSAEQVIALKQGGGIVLEYLGGAANFSRNITVSNKGTKYFEIASSFTEDSVVINVTPKAIGTGTIVIKDKKSAKTPLTLTVRIENILPPAEILAVEDAVLTDGGFSATLVNHGTETVTTYGLRCVFLGEDGSQLFVGAEGRNDYAREVVAQDFVSTVTPGGQVVTGDSLHEGYTEAKGLRVAVDGFTTLDGVRYSVPENSLRWFEIGVGELPAAGDAAEAVSLEERERELATQVEFGFNSVELVSGFAEHYGFEHIGLWVTSVSSGSRADKAKLKEGDLVFAVDGVMWADDPMIIDRAKSVIAGGGKVVLSVERKGKVVKLTLK